MVLSALPCSPPFSYIHLRHSPTGAYSGVVFLVRWYFQYTLVSYRLLKTTQRRHTLAPRGCKPNLADGSSPESIRLS